MKLAKIGQDRTITALLGTAWAMLAGTGPLLAQPTGYVLTGNLMDTRSNWLSGVRVELKRAGVVTNTDTNGHFKLQFSAAAPLVPDPSGILETIELTREAYFGRIVGITDAGYFAKPIVVKMERSRVGKDCVGFTTLMPEGCQIIDVIARIKTDTPHAYDAPQLRDALEHIATHTRTAPVDREASFYAWVPPDAKRLTAAFLLSLHGIGTLDDPVLRRFSREYNVALVGVFGEPVQRGCYPLQLMDKPLERLGALVGHPELASLPVLTFGHSNGTGFATVYAVDRADRLIGWVSYHSGFGWQLLLPGVEKAPGLVIHGQLDECLNNGQEQAVMKLRSQRHAPVAMMLEGTVTHAPVDREATWEFIVEFCKAAMRTRLSADGSLHPVDLKKGWLGGLYNRRIGGQQLLPVAPIDKFAGDRSTANWLLDEQFARTWQAYGNKDPRR